MTTTPKYVIGNWKTNPKTQDQAQTIFNDLFDYLTQNPNNQATCTIGIAPSFVHLPLLGLKNPQNSDVIFLGGQDVCAYTLDTGAYTGDISASQLVDVGAKFALIGHSERRQYHGENDEILTQKIHHALTANLSVIFCIGETKAEYQAGQTRQVLEKQLAILEQFAKDFANQSTQNNQLPPILVAYEPVWAIGTGMTPSAQEVDDTHNFISEVLSTLEIFAPILYGGSVNDKNAQEFADLPMVDGVLVGGASLKVDSFSQIIRAFID